MKAQIIFPFIIAILAVFSLQAQSPGYELRKSEVLMAGDQVKVYATAGAAGYEVAEGRPSGPEFRAGFMAKYGTLAIQGSGSYNSYQAEGVTRRFYAFEGGIGAYITPQLSLTAGFTYYGFTDGSDGAYGIVIRPAFELVKINDRLSVVTIGAISLTDDFMNYSGSVGMSYRLQ